MSRGRRQFAERPAIQLEWLALLRRSPLARRTAPRCHPCSFLSPSCAPIADEHRYLSFERRGLWGQSAYNVGYAYFSGLALGGLVGCVSGLRSAPNRHARIVLNSVLNGSGRYGARAGNAAGILAMVYTVAGE